MENIEKPAVITEIQKDGLVLRITNCSGCAQCAVKSFCAQGETQSQTIVVPVADTSNYCLGEEVVLLQDATLGLRAVVLSYVIPLILLLMTVFGASWKGFNDFISGISGIIVLIPYYFGLFLLKDKMKSDFQFRILKKNKNL